MDKEGRGRETLHSLLVSIAPGWAMIGTGGGGGGGGRAAALGRKGTKRKEEDDEEEESQHMMKKESDEDHLKLFSTPPPPPPLKAMMLLLQRILDIPTEIRYTQFNAVPEIEEPEEVVVVSKSDLVHLELLAHELATSFKDY